MSLETRTIIQKGSKSFFFASLFFDREMKRACWDLYQWCRHCDDVIDNAAGVSSARENLADLRKQWSYSESGLPASNQFMIAHDLKRTYQIPSLYFKDLLMGFEMDVEGRRFLTISELETYCYCVAGVVGLKMCYIMGVSDTKSFQHAIDLGKAMQLTNIARDVKEDFENGRIYLPLEWLNEERISEENFGESEIQKKYNVVLKTLDRADGLYRSGYQGLKYLPLRAALAVSIAASIYSYIGEKIRATGPTALESRTVVSPLEKLFCAVKGTLRVIPIAMTRIFEPWTALPLKRNEGK